MFPRPLYPPDANRQGKKPSPDGPDIEAYKRGVWRAGRWPGPASGFDRQLSNQFSHGQPGGNVGSSGIAGFQRQMGIDPTGWVGRSTFNTLASALVPEGPHKGEPVLDANACNLIAEAYAIYGGDPDPPDPIVKQATTRERALAGAVKWLGTTENPPGTNKTPFGRWYGVDGQPWCAIFASYCYEVEAGGSPSFDPAAARYAYCPYIVSDARNGRYGLAVTGAPTPGDLVVYDWQRDGTYDHVGLFESGNSSSWTAIEGNTSVDNNSNGGQVMRRQRSSQEAAVVFVRVAEP
jgi:hypothetical protein